MAHEVTRDGMLFPVEVVRLVANVEWGERTGWRLWVAHRHAGEDEWTCVPLELDHMSYPELITALDSYVSDVRGW